MDEKRRYHRFNIELPGSFKVINGHNVVSIATTVDISALGLCLVTKKQLKSGTKLSILVDLPEYGKVTVEAEVMWVREVFGREVREYKIGVKISDQMKADEKKFIKFYANKLLEFSGKK